MIIDIITLFPDMFGGPFDESIIRRAQDKSIVKIGIHNLRNWALDKRGTVDDRPYGGGTGMLLRPEPIFNAVEEVKGLGIRDQGLEKNKQNSKSEIINHKSKIILLDAGGIRYTQEKAEAFSKLDQLIVICGHYEGVDYRVHEHLADEVVSIGDFILTGGEIPAMLVVDSLVRLLPGVLEKEDATQIESFSLNMEHRTWSKKGPSAMLTSKNEKRKAKNEKRILEFPQYTKPDTFRGWAVPDILKSGNHAEIEKWRSEEAVKRTKRMRPDLL